MTTQTIKQRITGLTELFCSEKNTFQRLIIIHDYVNLLNRDSLTKKIVNKLFNNIDKKRDEAVYPNNFWMYYATLEAIRTKMKAIKKQKNYDKNTLCYLFANPYSNEMLKLSFRIINSSIFDQLDQKCFFNEAKKDDKTYFDEKKSILFIKGQSICINKQDKLTNAHKILKYIFIGNKDNLNDDFFYSEIAEEEFGELDYRGRKNNWKRYNRACEYIDNKIDKQTNGKIRDFLIYNTGSKGRVKVNKKYL